MIRFALFLPLLLAIAACQPSVQTTSGADYIARGPILDPAIRAAAAIEPDLRLPARIGIARIEDGALSIAPAHEAAAWDDFTARHAAMGSFVPVAPAPGEGSRQGRRDPSVSILDQVRRAAARQHVDYLLVYELGTTGGPSGNTPFALADITIVGGLLLPTRTTEATATGSVAFVDVRNGYPYGSAVASEQLNGLARSFNARAAVWHLEDRAARRVFEALLPQTDAMLDELSRRSG